jgi:hypothetical protein
MMSGIPLILYIEFRDFDKIRQILARFLLLVDISLFSEKNAMNTFRARKIFISTNFRIAGLILSIFSTGLLFSLQIWQPNAAGINQEELPIYGWIVCEDLGMGEVPGVPNLVQRFRLCHPQAWELLAYCLEPELPPPPEGTICERIDADTFWCEDDIQQLRQYQILQTPTPIPPDTETPTPTPTSTFTLTSTPTDTPTTTPTITPTDTPTTTPTLTVTSTMIPADTATSTPITTAIVTPRPPMGGSGNLHQRDIVRWVTGLFFIVIGLSLALVEGKKRLNKSS